MDTINVVLVGVGGYGRKLAIAMSKVPSLRLVACYHPDATKARSAAEVLGARPISVKGEIATSGDIDAVMIATPDPSHLDYVEYALRGGKHVFVEKPMVGSWREARRLQELVEDSGRVFFVGHNMRRAPGFRFLRDELDAGRLGKPVTFHISLSHGGAFHWPVGEYWRTCPDLCREGPMRVNGVHASDVLEYLLGPIDSVYARIQRLCAPPLSPDSGIAMARIGDVSGTICTHWCVPSLNQFQFQFADAIVHYDMKTLRIRYGRDVECVPAAEQVVPLPDVDVRVEQLKAFSRAITFGEPVETGFREGARAVMFMEACWQSSVLNREFRLEELL